MSTKNFFTTALMAVALTAFIACGDSDNPATIKDTETTTEQHEHNGEATHQHDDAEMVYQCPMKCEGDLVYNDPGTCPVCKMELKPVADEHHGHDH